MHIYWNERQPGSQQGLKIFVEAFVDFNGTAIDTSNFSFKNIFYYKTDPLKKKKVYIYIHMTILRQ